VRKKYAGNPEKSRKISLQKNVSDKVVKFKKSILSLWSWVASLRSDQDWHIDFLKMETHNFYCIFS